MIDDPAGAVEGLRVQPIVIPRQFYEKTNTLGEKSKALGFYVVFTFTRRNDQGHYVPLSARKTDSVAIPPELIGRPGSHNATGARSYWPTYIASLIRHGGMSIRFFEKPGDANAFHTISQIDLIAPADLEHVGWNAVHGDALWGRLLDPSARVTKTAELRQHRAAGRVRTASWVEAPARVETDEIRPDELQAAASNPWSASDLRPSLRVESIDTRLVARDIQSFLVRPTTDDPIVDLVRLLQQPNERLLAFVEQKDPSRELAGLLHAIQRRGDPKFEQEILPRLRESATFRESLTRLSLWRDEFLLAPSRGEILRQSRFVDSSRNRKPPASLPVAAVRPVGPGVPISLRRADGNPVGNPVLRFERQVARLRQHPGLMRRLYLTVRCEVAWDPAVAPCRSMLVGGAVGALFADHPDTFVAVTTKTMCDLDCNPKHAYFRPSPDQPVRFYGPGATNGTFNTEAQTAYQQYHTLAKNLFQVSQEDPATAMRRASQVVGDLGQASPSEARVPTLNGGGATLSNDALHRINAVNIYHRNFDSMGTEQSVAAGLIARSRADTDRLIAFNEHVDQYLIASGAKTGSGVVRLVGFARVLANPDAVPPLFHAENLMMGFSVFVRSKVAAPGRANPWRSLNRRMVDLSIPDASGGYSLRFEEEGFLATSIVVPPRPQTGTVTAVTGNNQQGVLTFGLLGLRNTTVKGVQVATTDRTVYVNDLNLDQAADSARLGPTSLPRGDLDRPLKGDVILVALNRPPAGSTDTGLPVVDQVFVHPVLVAKQGNAHVFDAVVTEKGYTPFTAPVILDCGNENPEGTAIRGNAWRRRIVFAPSFTRLVDFWGDPIQPGAAPPRDPNKPFVAFHAFTAEVQERAFAQVIGLSNRPSVAAPAAQTRPVLTNLGPINQVWLGQLPPRPMAELPLPNMAPLEAAPDGLVPVLGSVGQANRSHVTQVSRLDGAALQVVRGWVAEVGFLFAFTIQKDKPTTGDSHRFLFEGKDSAGTAHTESWWVPTKLETFSGASGAAVALLDIVCPWALRPAAFDWLPSGPDAVNSVAVVARAKWIPKVGKTPTAPEAPPRIEVTSLEVAAPAVKREDGGLALRVVLDLRRVDGGAMQLHYPLDLKLPDGQERRLVHPFNALSSFVEIFTETPGAVILARGWPQRLFGSLVRRASDNKTASLRFPDGSELPVAVDPAATFPALASGFFRVEAPAFPGTATAALALAEELWLAGEVTRVDRTAGQIGLIDGSGQEWTIRHPDDLDLDLPLGAVASTVRKLRHLVPGEWVSLGGHMDGAKSEPSRDIRVATWTNGPAKAQAWLLGRFTTPLTRAIADAAEGSTEFRACGYRSFHGREFTAWSDATTTPADQLDTAWSHRLILAETLAQYEKAPSDPVAQGFGRSGRVRRASFAARLADPAPTGPPRHVMVSEMIARWANWGLGLEQPGHPDRPRGELSNDPAPDAETQEKPPYTITLGRPHLTAILPNASAPFDVDSWQFPPLRFDRDYEFCLRRVDLAGNHLYEEPPLPTDAVRSAFAAILEPLAGAGGGLPVPFRRANLPVAPLVAWTPDRLAPTLRTASATTPVRSSPSFDPGPVSRHFLYLPSDQRELLLVLLTDALAPTRELMDDAHLEILPPPIDVETMLLHGPLDGRPAHEVHALIQRHERYLDLPEKSRALGRMAVDGEVNYLPDPMAARLTVAVAAAITEQRTAPPVHAHFFPFGPYSDPDSPEPMSPWPHVRWVRLALRSAARGPGQGAKGLPLPPPETRQAPDATTITIHLPPGVTGEATLSVRPANLDNEADEYARMARDHGRETRTVRLVHATNGPWARPAWVDLAEPPRDAAAPPSAVRDLIGSLDLDRPTTGAFSVTAGWNDPWDEALPAQHEPGRVLVEVDGRGRPTRCLLESAGFGFGTEAIVRFDAAGLSFRIPTFRARLWCGQLQGLEAVDAGAGCNVLFRIRVTSLPVFCRPTAVPAHALAWHDERGRLLFQILNPGAFLGPYVHIDVSAERSPLPRLSVTLRDGKVDQVGLVGEGQGWFAGPLRASILRRPPFDRVAEVQITAFTPSGGIAAVAVKEGGGWYATAPHCLAHDPEGDGFGALLSARLDDAGGVIAVDVVCHGRDYSPEAKVECFNDLGEVPEQVIGEPTAEQVGVALTFSIRQAFRNPNARAVTCIARGLSRFRQYLLPDQAPPGGGCDPAVESGGALDIRRHRPRTSAARVVDVVAHVRPIKPDVRYMLPAFAWSVLRPEEVAPDVDPFRFFQTRATGRIAIRRDVRVRLYLERPWHATGTETLAVVVAPAILNTTLSSTQPKLRANDGGVRNPAAIPSLTATQPSLVNEPVAGYAIDDLLRPIVTRWGFDPARVEVALPPLNLAHFPLRHRDRTTYEDVSPEGSDPSVQSTFYRPVWLALHDVHYDSVKELWYADVQVDVSAGGPTVLAQPMVQLGVARYQAHGLPDRRLSPIVACDMFPLMGRRDLDVARLSERDFSIRFAGEFDLIAAEDDPKAIPRRQVFARLEARDPDLAEEIVHYIPPPTTGEPPALSTTAMVQEIPLRWNKDRLVYEMSEEFDLLSWKTAHQFHGRTTLATLSIVEYVVSATSEGQSNPTDAETVMFDDRPCARQLVYSATFRLSREGGQV